MTAPVSRPRASIARRLIVGAGLWSAVLLLAGALIFTTHYRNAVHRVDDERFAAILDSLAVYAETNDKGDVYFSRLPGDPRFERSFSGHYWQVAKMKPKGAEIVARSQSLFDADLPVSQQTISRADKQRGMGIKQDMTGPNDEPMRSLTKAYLLSDNKTVLVITAAADRRPGDKEIFRFRLIVAGVLGMFGIGLILGIFWQVRFGLKPLYEMEREVARVSQGEAEDISGEYPRELTPLVDGLNSLIRHNKEIVTRARTHVGNLAHAVKTPISVLLNETASENSDLAKLVRRQAETMSQQVSHHLRRASAAARAQALGARTQVSVTSADLVRTMRRLFKDKGISIDSHIEGDPWFRGEKQDLEELLGNLLENACKWAGSRVRLSVGLVDGNLLQIRVEDDGPGLSDAEKAQVIKRGERLDEAAPGSGLGLSIVHDLAKAYGGEFTLADSEWGGLRAEVLLPASTVKTGI